MQGKKHFSFQNVYTLLPQSPLIHFQPNAVGTSLRATEVKPKLDAFLRMRYRLRNHREVPDKWLIPAAKSQDMAALNYKLRIEQLELMSSERLGAGTNYDIFYGNMVSEEERKKPRSEERTDKMGLNIKEKMTVICFNPELRAWIDESIDEFFVVTNFGTMQHKGFGSFLVADYIEGDKKTTVKPRISYSDKDVGHLLTLYTGSRHCYGFSSDEKSAFRQIKMLYAIIKSGVNLGTGKGRGGGNYVSSILFDYFQKLPNPIYHEKAKIKEDGVAPAVKRTREVKKTNARGKEITVPLFSYDSVPPKGEAKYRYVRALFGTGERLRFNNVTDKYGNQKRVTVKIAHDYVSDGKKEEDKIARFPSPIFFKIIAGRVFFVGVPIDDEIFGKHFRFTGMGGKSVLIKVPERSELPEDFLDAFMESAVSELVSFIGMISSPANQKAYKKFQIIANISLTKVV